MIKNNLSRHILINHHDLEQRIYLIRGKRVMLDSDLAKLYGVKTKQLNQQISRNLKRFPPDFMYQLTRKEVVNLKSQIVTSSLQHIDPKEVTRWGGRRKLPRVFTEQGVAMLSTVLNSERAIQVNIQIVRAFVRMRELITSHKDLEKKIRKLESKMEEKFGIHDEQFRIVFETFEELKQSLNPPPNKPKRKIGFHP